MSLARHENRTSLSAWLGKDKQANTNRRSCAQACSRLGSADSGPWTAREPVRAAGDLHQTALSTRERGKRGTGADHTPRGHARAATVSVSRRKLDTVSRIGHTPAEARASRLQCRAASVNQAAIPLARQMHDYA